MKRFQSRLLLLAGFLLVFPFFLRRRPRVERRVTIMAPPDAIFPFLNDLRQWPTWTEWGRRDELEYTYGEPSSGDGAVQRWRNSHLSGELHVIRSESDSRLDYELRMKECATIFGRILLQHDGACTRVVWRCVWDRARNPYRRYLDLVYRRVIARDFQRGLDRLKVLVEQKS